MQRVHSRRSEGSEAEVDGLGTVLKSIKLYFQYLINYNLWYLVLNN